MVGLLDPNGAPLELDHEEGVTLSADGSTIVGGVGGSAFRWTSATGTVPLGTIEPDVLASGASGVSADGAVVVGGLLKPLSPNPYGLPGVPEAFRWTEAEGMVGLGFPSGYIGSWATVISDDASAIGGGLLTADFAQLEPALWDEANGWVTIASILSALGVSTGGGQLSDVVDISSDGCTILGNGSGSSPHGRAPWMLIFQTAEPVPGPALGPQTWTALLLALGVALLLVARRLR
jgi:uncharacterized membrane protein